MVKTIDINKKGQVSVKKVPQKTFGVTVQREALPTAPEEKKPVAKGRQNFITRFIDIMVYDILHKLHLAPDKPENIIEAKEDKEKYEEFCRLARGER